MTDNEIINDFEKEIKYVRENEKYDDFNPIVDIDLCEDVLDLINRQQAEIKQLETIERFATKTIEKQSAEIERLKNELELANADKVIAETHEKAAKEMFVDVTQRLKTEKSEAIKEFAERLKCGVPQEIGVIRCADVDNLVKEMTEVQE